MHSLSSAIFSPRLMPITNSFTFHCSKNLVPKIPSHCSPKCNYLKRLPFASSKIPSNVSVAIHPYSLSPPVYMSSQNAEVKNIKSHQSAPLFAVFSHLGKQYKVSADDVVTSDHLDNVDLGDVVVADKVLLLGSDGGTILGHPLIPEARVRLVVEELTLDKKVITIKFRRRKNSRDKTGFRRKVCILRVVGIDVPPAAYPHIMS